MPQASQLDETTKRLLSRLLQPKSQVQPAPGQDKSPAMMAPTQGVAHNQDEGRQMFVHNLFALIHNAGAAEKAKQLKHAIGVLHSLNNSWQDAQELYPDDKKKAMDHFSSMPSVTHILEDKKNVKQLGKLLQFDFMEPEKKKTVWHQALGQVVESSKQLPFIKQIAGLMDQHKQNQAAKAGDPNYAQREQDASAVAKQFAGQARGNPALEMQQATMALREQAIQAREIADKARIDLSEERNKLTEERNKTLEEGLKEKRDEFETREKRLVEAHKDLQNYRKEQIGVARDKVNQHTTDTSLRRLVIGLNYAPQLLKPGEAEAFGMQMDENGQLIPVKSPLAATAQTKNAQQQAGVMDSLIGSTLSLLDDPGLKDKLGPYQGRISEVMMGRIGTDVPEFGLLRTLGSFDASGMLRLHFGARGGMQQYEKFKNLIDTGKMDEAALRESLQGFKVVADTYKNEIRTSRTKKTDTTSDSSETVIDLRKNKTP
jgi:hypothetical protein